MVFSIPSARSLLLAVLLSVGLPSTAWAQQHFTNCIDNNTNDATVIIPSDATVSIGNGDSLSVGDEIALFSNDGQCAGVIVWDSTNAAAAISVADRDSIAGFFEGYETGERLKYRIWRKSDNQEFEVSSASYTCTLLNCREDGLHERNAVYEVTKLDASTSALPVELTSFAATRSGQKVVLEWSTASETNNSGFKVQHKSRSAGSWSTLSFVEGAGTSSNTQNYRYKADDLGYGTHQFRLRQLDRDGSGSTSKTVEVALTLDQAYKISKVAPNPVRQSGTIDLTVKTTQEVTARLYDVLGREQGVLFKQSLSADQTETIRLNANRFPSGQYFLQIEGEQFQTTRRVTIVQ